MFYLPGKSTQWLVKPALISLRSHQCGHDHDWAPGGQRAAGHVTLAVNGGETVEEHEVTWASIHRVWLEVQLVLEKSMALHHTFHCY